MLDSVAEEEGALCYQGRLHLGGAADFAHVSVAGGVGASKGTVLCVGLCSVSICIFKMLCGDTQEMETWQRGW